MCFVEGSARSRELGESLLAYAGKWVALHDEVVVGYDESLTRVRARMEAKGIDPSTVCYAKMPRNEFVGPVL